MTQDEIIRMAREAGFEVVDGQLRLYFDGSKALLKPNYMGTIVDGLKEFAALVAANEREKYKAMDKELSELYEMAVNQAKTIKKYQDAVLAEREACAKVCDDIGDSDNGYGCAAAIRARAEK